MMPAPPVVLSDSELDFQLAFVNTQFFIVTLSNSIFFDKFPPKNLQRIFKYFRIVLTRQQALPSAYLPADSSFSILQVIGIIKRRTGPQKIPLRIL